MGEGNFSEYNLSNNDDDAKEKLITHTIHGSYATFSSRNTIYDTRGQNNLNMKILQVSFKVAFNYDVHLCSEHLQMTFTLFAYKCTTS